MRTSITLISLFLIQLLPAQLIEATPLIHTHGTAIVYAEPDEVLLNFSVITSGKDLVDAREKNRSTSAQAIQYLKSKSVQAQHIQTQYLNVGIRYKDRHKLPENKLYEASQSFNICITNLNRYEEIMMGLLELDIHNLSSPTFRTTEHRVKMDEARGKAIKAALEKAEALASELGQEIGMAYNIVEVDLSNSWRSNQNAYANFSGDNTQSSDTGEGFATGQLEIKAAIDVSFHLIQE